MRNEDYGRIWRLIADRLAVQLELNIQNRTFPEGRTQYNVVAEIPGTDKAAEVVMLGGHLDSWHAATGATDNAIGCSMMMEATRILHAIGVKPRRTIRVALWSGEEQGLLGSQAYVKEHFGTFENPKPEYDELRRLLQHRLGHGTGAGDDVFGPPEAAAILREPMAPFPDNGVMARATTAQPAPRRLGSHLVQRGGPAGHRRRPGPDRVPDLHLAYQPRYLRAGHRGRRAAARDGRLPRRCITSRCATGSCRGSRRTRCRRYRRSSEAPSRVPSGSLGGGALPVGRGVASRE